MGPNRVEVYVIASVLEVASAAALNGNGLIAAAKNVPREVVAFVQSNGVGAQEPMHAIDEIGIGSFQDQVEVIAHGCNRRVSASPESFRGQPVLAHVSAKVLIRS
jgi:hypothetical protein